MNKYIMLVLVLVIVLAGCVEVWERKHYYHFQLDAEEIERQYSEKYRSERERQVIRLLGEVLDELWFPEYKEKVSVNEWCLDKREKYRGDTFCI